MDLETLVKNVDAGTARAFVTAARHVIDALLIEGQRWQAAQTPTTRDYTTAELPRDTPAGGWLAHEEVRDTAQRLAEAVAAEKWRDGVVCAVRLLSLVGGVG
ncbi:MAG: hypothetical protein PVJ57_09380 [Phycisphaerae bacterium]